MTGSTDRLAFIRGSDLRATRQGINLPFGEDIMRATPQQQKAGAGVSEVSSAFERIGWGVAENARHDLGTDLWTMARDDRLFDLGLLVGVQVKAGPSYFNEPVRDAAGETTGWWFRDNDREHIDSWLSYTVPHVVVLHDLATRVSYWQHVTAATVVSTGQGAKILIPKVNTIDEEHQADLVRVAGTQRPPTAWEGSAWTGAADLKPRDMLRYALVVPRVVAPHPNVGYTERVSPAQVIAMLIQARLNDIEAIAQRHDEVPSLEEAPASNEWQWRFVGALAQRLTAGDIDALFTPVGDAPTPFERAAATATAAAGLLEEGRGGGSDRVTRLGARIR